ncbi:PRD domain-containing protein [Rothia aerolata]|uniref:Transcription antiterminator BglG n=1 Tax=Rothia aerolata TaxID=1812262 RepID=A0A917MQ11_9MICC|nr:PRD domain-containing protein [Rothia aerolata]GGH56245.1 transcription antiterminator BglG [Rothia aerolata]
MKIAHIYNNNVVLAVNAAGEQSVVIGRGLAFNKKKGQELDTDKIEQTFVPEQTADDYSQALLAEIPSEVLALATELEDYARGQLGFSMSHSLVLPMSDHLNYALQRAREGVEMDFPLAFEVEHLYPREVAFGRYALKRVKEQLGVELPDGEATAFAMHLVNTMFSEADLAKAYKMTELFAQIFTVIAFAYGNPIDQSHVSVARFVTHLRYLFVRVESVQALTGRPAVPAVQKAVKDSYPKADSCALKVKTLLEMHLGVELSADEQTYLTIHIARLAEELWQDSSTNKA